MVLVSYMSEVVISDVEKGLKDVFHSLYVANCEIEGEEVTSEDEKTLGELDSYEVLENMKDLMQDLLNAKRELKKTDKSELVSRCEQFEAMLQKLEADVRVHIRVTITQIEQQLKLHVEAAQARIDDLQRSAEVRSIDELLTALHDKERELEGFKKAPVSAEAVSHHRVLSLEQPGTDASKPQKANSEANLQRLMEVADHRHKAVLRLEKEVVQLKSALEAKTQECEQLKSSIDRLQLVRKSEEMNRKRSEERVLEKLRIGNKQRSSPDRALTDRLLAKRQTESDWISRKVITYSPYRKVDHFRNSSKSKLDVSPVPCQPDLRALHHSRTTSERIAKVSPTLRGHPRV